MKLNELIRAMNKAQNQMIDIENLSDLELDEIQAKYGAIKNDCADQKESSKNSGRHT